MSNLIGHVSVNLDELKDSSFATLPGYPHLGSAHLTSSGSSVQLVGSTDDFARLLGICAEAIAQLRAAVPKLTPDEDGHSLRADQYDRESAA